MREFRFSIFEFPIVRQPTGATSRGLLYIIVGLFGLCFGSFLNVCISRLPRGESIVLPRSHCPRCNHAIRWYDNIPLVSYLVLRGRCRDCHVPISPLYPAVEALTALVLILTFRVYGLGPEFIKYALFGMLLIVLIFTDLLDRRIPHAVTIFGICLGLVFSFIIPVDDRPLGWILRHWDIYLEGVPCLRRGRRRGSSGGGRAFLRGGRGLLPFGWKAEGISGFRRRHADVDGGNVSRHAPDADDDSSGLVRRIGSRPRHERRKLPLSRLCLAVWHVSGDCRHLRWPAREPGFFNAYLRWSG